MAEELFLNSSSTRLRSLNLNTYTMIKRYTSNIHFDCYLNAAKKNGIQYKSLISDKPIGYFHKNKKRLYISYNKLGVNNCVSYLFATNKFRTYELLDLNDLPHPKAITIRKEETIDTVVERVTEEIKTPWVVKPIKGSEGKGVTVMIDDKEELKEAIEFARKIAKKVIVEEFIHGKHYRIMVFRKEIIDVVERVPAYVVGDGKIPLKDLIKQKNEHREKVQMEPIRVDQELLRQIQEKDLNLQSIPKKTQRVSLRQNCNMCAGGETKRIGLKQISTDNIELFKQSVDLLGLDMGGIDFITPDISTSYKKIPCAINEINKAPMHNVHYFADMKMDNFVAEEILRLFFK